MAEDKVVTCEFVDMLGFFICPQRVFPFDLFKLKNSWDNYCPPGRIFR